MKRFHTLRRLSILAVGLLASATFAQSSNMSITSNFNGTNIASGDDIWFNSHFSVSDPSNILESFVFTNSTIDFTSNGKNYDIAVPNADITFDPNATGAVTTFNSKNDTWDTVIGKGASGDDFLSGLLLNLPTGLQGGSVKSITWSGTLTSSTAADISWQWGAAVYKNLPTDYNALGVKAADNTGAGGNSDHVGTMENEKDNVLGGARGGGGSNFTGSWSATGHTKSQPTPEPMSMAVLGLGAVGLLRKRSKRS